MTPDGVVLVDGTPVDSLYKCYPGDWLDRQPEWLGALEGGLPCANPGRSLIAQSKAFFALLWHLADEGQFLTPAERDWVRAYLPRTALSPLPGPWVAKPYWEREGQGISPGEGEGPAAPFCAYQQRIEPLTLPARLGGGQPGGQPGGGQPGGGDRVLGATPVVGVYLVEGRPAGYLTRIGGKVTDRSAHMVPTYVKSSAP